jgi:acyl dehydratase
MITITPETDVAALIGRPPAYSEWFTIEQGRINEFAEVTGDRQWLHTDPERAATGPYGATIAHGFLLLALLPALAASAIAVEGYAGVVNYGLDRVRFPSAARVGSRIRDGVVVDSVAENRQGTLVTLTHTIEVDKQHKPACVAQQLRLLRR